MHQFFGPGGVLAKSHPAYEFRRGQLQMAEAVEQALAEKRHLIVEAGTGTGKTLAYLVPVIRSGKRVIISTGTKNLQEQLFYKDVPFLERAIFGADSDQRLKVCYMKGRNNYLCRKKLYDLTDRPVLNGLEEIDQFRSIRDWEKITTTGDRAELTTVPEIEPALAEARCARRPLHRNEVQAVRPLLHHRDAATAAESDIIIVNHHLFFADLAIKRATDGAADAGILPEAAAVIFDEAHELEDVAGSYFGVTVSNVRVDDLVRDVEFAIKEFHIASPTLLTAAHRLRERSQLFFTLVAAGRWPLCLREPTRVPGRKWRGVPGACRTRLCICMARSRRSRRSRTNCSTWRAARKNCGCNSAS